MHIFILYYNEAKTTVNGFSGALDKAQYLFLEDCCPPIPQWALLPLWWPPDEGFVCGVGSVLPGWTASRLHLLAVRSLLLRPCFLIVL